MTPSEAHYALQKLISQGRIREAQVRAVLNGRSQEIAVLREQLATLEGIDGRGSRRGARGTSRGKRAPARRRRVAISPKVRALRRLQGKYMGYVRRLKPAEKARVRAVREKQGMQAAIRLASSLSKAS
ncbi:MAG TPA: hypothetical protein VGS98_01505 [Thermoanaerobaculia bacterium]|nr:hypothetical protein [Thermoanaerobaculia bacterium]